jgi:hypothetical protein
MAQSTYAAKAPVTEYHGHVRQISTGKTKSGRKVVSRRFCKRWMWGMANAAVWTGTAQQPTTTAATSMRRVWCHAVQLPLAGCAAQSVAHPGVWRLTEKFTRQTKPRAGSLPVEVETITISLICHGGNWRA